MKNTKYFLGTLLVAGLVAGCSSSWDQDPLAKKNAVVKDGQREPTEDRKPEGTGSDNIRLSSEKTINFTEGNLGEFQMRGWILKPGYKTRILIENATDFPGATLTLSADPVDPNATIGKFVWNPPVGTVTGVTGNPIESKILKILVLGEKAGEGVERKNFEISLSVGKHLRDPEISAITNSNITITEGQVANFTFQVVDKDAGADPATWPTLQALPKLGYGNISQFATITNMSAVGMGGGTYSVSMKVDLTNVELTKGKGAFGFDLQATSRFGKNSMRQSIYVTVLTSFANLQSTWFDVLDFALGVKDEHQFLIYDPKEELLVGNPLFTGVPAGASITCSGVGVTKQLCKLTWAPDFMSAAGDFTVRANVQVTNQGDSSQSKAQFFDLRMRVNSAPPVSVSHAGGN